MTGLPSYATDPKMTGQPSPVEKPPYKPTGRDGFTAYMDKIAGGAKWKDGVMIDGPFKGLDRNGLMAKAREQYAALPDNDKQVWQNQSTGSDLEVGGRPAVTAKTGSGPGGGLRTGSLSTSSGIDWLKANRTDGPALAQQEANVGKTGDRFKSPVEKPVMPAKPAAMAGQPLKKTGYDPMASAFAVGGELAPKPVKPTERGVGYDTARGGYPIQGSPNVSSAPQPTAKPIEPATAAPVMTAPKPVTADTGIAATPIKPVTAAPVSPSLVEKPSSMDILNNSLGQADTAKRAFLAKSSMPAPNSVTTDELDADQKARNNDVLRSKNPGAKASLIPGYASDAAKGNERMVTAGDILKSTRQKNKPAY